MIPLGIMVEVLDCSLEVNEFELQSCYYIHIQINNLGTGMDPVMGQIVSVLSFYKDGIK